MTLGVHVSISGGLHLSVGRAVELGCSCFQIFGRNPRSWDAREVREADALLFRGERGVAGLYPAVIHTTYLINLSSPDDTIYDRSVELFKSEIRAAETLGVEYIVTHLGSSRGSGRDEAFARVTGALKEVRESRLGEKTLILFENSAGSGDTYGSDLSDIGMVMEGARSFGLDTGLCVDTCHLFAAGYPMASVRDARGLAKRIDGEAGLERLKLIHLNDSKAPASSNVDRHEHIGKGRIGREVLKEIVNLPEFRGLPFILETPKKEASDDVRNLKTVRRMISV